jgi:hypothetical protein
MADLTIRFIFEPDFVSRLIGWETNSLWCHTEALSRDGQSWIGAHAGTGVQPRPLNYCKPTRERQYAIPVLDRAADAAYTWLESKLGTPYNYADILGLTLHARIGVSEHEVICSALMLQFMQQSGLEPLNCLPQYSSLITPETLHLSPLFIGKCTYKTD